MSSEVRPTLLGDLLEITSSKRIHMADYVASGIPFYRSKEVIERAKGNDISTELFISHAQFDLIKKRFGSPRDGDILLTSVGTLGVPYVVRGDGDFYFKDGNLTWMRNFSKAISPQFLYYWLTSPQIQQKLDEVSIGSTQKALTISALKALEIPLPPRAIQDEIVEVLGALSNRITLLRDTNATLEAIAQAMYKSWFVDFDPVRAKMEGRNPEGMDESLAGLFPNVLDKSELGLMPRGWTTRCMADVSTVGIGKTPPRKEQHWFSEAPNDVRWVSIRDMGTIGVYATRTSEFLTQAAVDKFNVRQVPDKTVLMSFKMTIGRVAITDGEMTTNEAIAHFKLSPGSPLTTEYIYLHLKQFNFSTLSSTSSIADAVNSKTVREIPILVPTPDVVAAFQNQIGGLFEKIKNTERQVHTLATLRDSLLPRLIAGLIAMPEAGSI